MPPAKKTPAKKSEKKRVVAPTKTILIIGEAGSGKSTLVNALRDKERSSEAEVAVGSRGITKELQYYVGTPINGGKVDIVDTPGVGDQDVKPIELVGKLQKEFASGGESIDAVVVTCDSMNCRLNTGMQVVKALVEHSFVKEGPTGSVWSNIIVVCTKFDKLQKAMKDDDDGPEARNIFQMLETRDMTTDRDGNPVPEGTIASFYAQAPDKWGTYVFTSKTDVSALTDKIGELPNLTISIDDNGGDALNDAMADVLGIERKKFAEELASVKEGIQQEMVAREEALKMQHLAHLAKVKKEAKGNLDEMKRLAKVEAEEIKNQAKVQAEKSAEARQKLEDKLDSQQKEYDETNKRFQQQLEDAKSQKNGAMASEIELIKQKMSEILIEKEVLNAALKGMPAHKKPVSPSSSDYGSDTDSDDGFQYKPPKNAHKKYAAKGGNCWPGTNKNGDPCGSCLRRQPGLFCQWHP